VVLDPVIASRLKCPCEPDAEGKAEKLTRRRDWLAIAQHHGLLSGRDWTMSKGGFIRIILG
jgi:hypothetical protein